MKFVEKSLFDGAVKVAISTKKFGMCHPRHEEFIDRLSELKQLTDSSSILCPRLGFTNQVVQGDYVSPEEQTGPDTIKMFFDAFGYPLFGFLRSVEQTDAGISSKLPIAIFGADCPVGIAITTPDQEGKKHLVMLHLGLMTMISKSGRSSLIEEVVLRLRKQNMTIEQFWIGFGAKSCCYGLNYDDDRWPLIKEWQNQEIVVQKGPRKGQSGIELGLIARNQLISMRVSPYRIQIDDYCTCCSGVSPENGLHYSNLLRHGQMARNAIVAWLK